MAEASGALKVGGRYRFQLLYYAQSPLHFRHYARLLRWRRNRDGKPPNLCHADGGEVRRVLTLVKKEFLTERVCIPGNQLRVKCAKVDTGSEDVILVDALGQLAIPNPATAEFIPIAAFVEQDVPWPQS